ncbi:hypothetical protein [Okeania sp. KiyG1]|nr:hypothetical protein [Okeania sp. KiyG1]
MGKRRKKEEGRRKKEEGRRKKEERKLFFPGAKVSLASCLSDN